MEINLHENTRRINVFRSSSSHPYDDRIIDEISCREIQYYIPVECTYEWSYTILW